MVELRKRKAHSDTAPSPVKKANSVKSGSSSNDAAAAYDSALPRKVVPGSNIALAGFGGEIETQEGTKTNLETLVEDSNNGVVIFTYPKASTPGCTTQACMFKDQYPYLTAAGFSIYGLSRDSPKSNFNFQIKHNLPYTLLCDPAGTLIEAIGMKKAPSGTVRGVLVICKDGSVQAASPGGPAATVEIVRNSVKFGQHTNEEEGIQMGCEKTENETEREYSVTGIAKQPSAASGDEAEAQVAAEVADTASRLDDGAMS